MTPTPYKIVRRRKKKTSKNKIQKEQNGPNLPTLVKKQDLSPKYLGNQTSKSHSPQVIP